MATVKVTPEIINQALRQADWAKIDAQSDHDIASNAASDPDAPPILNRTQTAAAMAKTVRKRLDLSQVEFAARFEIPVGTLRDWEQGRAQPDMPTLAYLRVIASEPEMVARVLAPKAA